MKLVAAFVAGIVAATALFSAFALFAQENPLSLRPLIVDIDQSVPVVADVALVTSGGLITSTLPLTVDVALQVRIAGPLSITVSGEAAPVVVAESTTATDELALTSEPIFQDIRWTIDQVRDIGQTWEYNSNLTFETTGRFLLLDIGLENIGKRPADIAYGDRTDLQIELVDDQGRSFAPYETGYQLNDLCEYAEINPGLTVPCFIPFETPVAAAGLKLRLTLQSESGNQVAELHLDVE